MTLAKLERKTKTLDISVGSQVGTERTSVGSQNRKDRERTALRCLYTCQMCQLITPLRDGEADHIIPLHLGGKDNDDNRQWLCKQCHKLKSDKEENERRNG